MSGYYLDASALVKRYTDEPGSDWVREITDPGSGNTVFLAEITLAEVAAALAAQYRLSGGITLQQRDRALSLFFQECDEHFLLLPVDRPIIERAVELTQNHRLRPGDLRSIGIKADIPPAFVASDDHLIDAARGENLLIDNPLDHPQTGQP